ERGDGFEALELERAKAQLEHENNIRGLEIEEKKMHLEMQRRRMQDHDGGGHPLVAIFLIGCFIVNILAAVWVFTDIRARNAGSGIWIVITLIAGLFGALIYGVMRLGDEKPDGTKTAKK
ncbi:MAG: hypothetical protein ACYTFG_03885, partial [Planctomycetota bacterium]